MEADRRCLVTRRYQSSVCSSVSSRAATSRIAAPVGAALQRGAGRRRELVGQQQLAAICSYDRRVQVRGGIDVVELRGLDERVERGGDFGAAS